MLPKFFFTPAVFLPLVLFLAGCLHTSLPPRQVLPDIYRLGRVAERQVQLETNSEVPEQSTLGHQYLFIGIPFGRISLADPKQALYESASRGLAQERIGITNASSAHPELKLSLEDLQLTAYDFIFIRRIVCRVRLKAEFTRPSSSAPLTKVFTATETDWVSLAFERELQRVLFRALDSSITTMSKEFGLSDMQSRTHQ